MAAAPLRGRPCQASGQGTLEHLGDDLAGIEVLFGQLAREAAVRIAEDEDRELLLADLATL